MKVNFSFPTDDREWIPDVEVEAVPAIGTKVGITPLEGSDGRYRLDEVLDHRHYITPAGQEIHVLLGEPRRGPSPRAVSAAITHYHDCRRHGEPDLEAMRTALFEAYREDGIGR